MNQFVWGMSAVFVLLILPAVARADQTSSPPPSAVNQDNPLSMVEHQIPDLSKRENFSAAMQIIVLLTVLSLAPSILLMMTSFTRIIIVFALLRQAMGAQQLPPNQILVGLAMFMTFLIMSPTWQRVNDRAVQPYMNGKISQTHATGPSPGSRSRVHDQPDQP